MIKSRFYLIRGDNVPIYVGFTNRPIKQRFAEHKADKDFSDYDKVTIEKLDELEYEFTWDEDTLYKNANEVSVREAQLIIEYGTQDSCYQKSIGGGQVWTYEKWFVKTNKDNPKFTGWSSKQIEEYIELHKSNSVKLKNYVGNTKDSNEVKLKHYVGGTKDSNEVKLKNYVGHTRDSNEVKLKHYVGNTKDSNEIKLKSYVGGTKDSNEVKLKNYVGHTKDSNEIKLKNYVGNTKDSNEIKLKNYVGNTRSRK